MKWLRRFVQRGCCDDTRAASAERNGWDGAVLHLRALAGVKHQLAVDGEGIAHAHQHTRRHCLAAPIVAARSALLSACGLPTSHQLSHDDFIAIMAFDANFAPALGFNSSDTAPSFERVVLAFFRAVGSARFGAGSAVADRDGRPSARPLASPPPL